MHTCPRRASRRSGAAGSARCDRRTTPRGESRNRYQGQETGSLSGYSIRLQYQAAESGSRLRLREKKRNGEGTRSEDRYRSLAAVRRRWTAGREASRKRSAPAQYPSKGKEKRGLIGMPRACERVERIPAPEGLNRWSTSPKRQPLRSESRGVTTVMMVTMMRSLGGRKETLRNAAQEPPRSCAAARGHDRVVLIAAADFFLPLSRKAWHARLIAL